MPTDLSADISGPARTGANVIFAYLGRYHALLAGQKAGELVDARRILESLTESIDVTRVSLTAHQELALQQFVKHGGDTATSFFKDVQNRRAVLQGFLADRLLDQNTTVERSIRDLTEARTFQTAADAAGPALDAAFYLKHVSEGQTDKAILDAIGLAVGTLAGAVAIAAGAPPLVVALAALGVGLAFNKFEDSFGEDFSLFTEGLIDLTANGLDAINTPVFEYFIDAGNWQPRRDPLALDLDGDGIEIVPEAAFGGALFDMDGDGVRTSTGWVAPDDGLLVSDWNANGYIDDGSELFGDRTVTGEDTVAADGFEALSTLDENADGKLDIGDASFDALRVWQDVNQDGVSQAEELKSLFELGIVSLGTVGLVNNINLAGENASALQGQFTRVDGSTGETHSLLFETNPFFSRFQDAVPVSAQAATLPSLSGAGKVRELQQAASLSDALRDNLRVYTETPTRAGQLARIDTLLELWAETSVMPTMAERAAAAGFQIEFQFGDVSATHRSGDDSMPASEAGSAGNDTVNAVAAPNPEHTMWVTRLGVLERFNGVELISFERSLALAGAQTDHQNAAGADGSIATTLPVALSGRQLELLGKSYEALSQSVYYGLALKTRLKPFFDSISVTVSEAGAPQLDFSLVESAFRDHAVDDAYNTFIDVHEFKALVNGWSASPFVAELYGAHSTELEAVTVWPADEVLFQTVVNGAATGNERANLVTGDDRANLLKGYEGNDTLLGGAGDDILDGGAGSDVLRGGAGDDIVGSTAERGGYTLRAGRRFGNDYAGGHGADTLYGTNHDDIYHFELGDGNDTVHDYSGHNTLHLGSDIDSGMVSVQRVDNQHLKLQIGTTGDSVLTTNWYSGGGLDELHFYDGSVWDREQLLALDPGILDGTEHDDVLKGKSVSEFISGFGGDDTLKGGDGDDLIAGGPGNDSLNGGRHNDTLLGGDGDDLVVGNSGTDILEGGAGDDVLGSTRERGSWTLVDERKVGNYYRGGVGDDHSIGTNYQDTYFFAPGDGQDSIREMNGNDDVLSFEGGVRPEDLWFSQQGEDLIIALVDTEDSVTVDGWYRSKARRIENFTVEGGETLDNVQLSQLVSAMAVFAPEPGMITDVPPELREELVPVIAASWQTSA